MLLRLIIVFFINSNFSFYLFVSTNMTSFSFMKKYKLKGIGASSSTPSQVSPIPSKTKDMVEDAPTLIVVFVGKSPAFIDLEYNPKRKNTKTVSAKMHLVLSLHTDKGTTIVEESITFPSAIYVVLPEAPTGLMAIVSESDAASLVDAKDHGCESILARSLPHLC